MPIYEWKCDVCTAVTDVIRSVADSDVPPEINCICETPGWRKLITTANFRNRLNDPTSGSNANAYELYREEAKLMVDKAQLDYEDPERENIQSEINKLQSKRLKT